MLRCGLEFISLKLHLRRTRLHIEMKCNAVRHSIFFHGDFLDIFSHQRYDWQEFSDEFGEFSEVTGTQPTDAIQQ